MELDLALSYVLIRFILPLVLGTAVIFRQNLFSCIYLILLLIGPTLPKPSAKTVLSGRVGYYVKAIIILSFLINVSHIVFQIVLFSAFPNYEDSIDYCTEIGRIYNLIGLHRYNGISVWSVLRLCGLDFLVLISAGALHVFIKDVYRHQIEVEREKEELAKEQENKRLERMEKRERRMTEAGLSAVSVVNTKAIQEKYKKKLRAQKASIWASLLTETIFLLLLCSAAVLNPSVSSSMYFLLFLSISSWISCNRSLGVQYHYIRVFISFYVSLHFIVLFIYQMEYMRPYLPPDDINARLFGLVDYVNINCTTVRQLDYNSFHWPKYVHSFVLIGLYFISATLIRKHFFTKNSFVIKSMKRLRRRSHEPNASHGSTHVRADCIPALITTTNTSSVWNKCNDDQNNLSECLSSSDYQTRDGEHTVINESLHLDEITRASNDSTPLLSDDKTGKHYNTSDRLKLSGISKAGLEIDSNGSIIWKPEPEVSNYSSISGAIGVSASRPESPITPMGPLGAESNAPQVSPFVQLIKLIKRGSYVGTLIVMMTWSITYHSWLSFILLLWSCIIWMIPNSRQACLKSSPALVTFALLLLIGQYIYSLNLTESELPSNIGTISMNEIGFKKYYELSYQPLFIKIFYTLMFWITLRQYFEDRETEKRKRFAQGVMIQPFNISYGTGQPGAPRHDLRRQMSLATTTGTHQSPAVQWVVDLLKELLIKYWIWIVASMLMVMSLSGDRVVLYRVIYMALFLSFILVFQLSFSLWRRFMYTFWLIVIIYSMIILTAIYTYQFNEFPDYWNDYLKINKELQADLGLQVYDHDAWILFKELFTPTFFLIITIIQVHFLHKSFLEFSDFEKQWSLTSPTSTTSQSVTTESPNQNNPNEINEIKLEIEIQSESSNDTSTPNTVKSVNKKSSLQSTDRNKASASSSATPFATPSQSSPVKHQISSSVAKEDQSRPESKTEDNYKSSLDEIKELIELLWHKLEPKVDMIFVVVWRLLELHIIKAILFSAVFVSIADISAMNTIFVILVVLAMRFTQFEGIISHLLGLWSGILIIVKMLFQLQFAQQIVWTTNCTQNYNEKGIELNVFPFNTTVDNREYIGFKKSDNIFGYIFEYLILILILVFRTVVIIYQNIYRTKRNERAPPPGVVFIRVSRKDADRDLKGLTMFLINYCFYKFGVEICFILLTISIGSRNDLFSVLYSFWLLFLVLMNRQTIEKVWPYFVGFLVIVLPLQYLLCLGIPPGLCIDYPWESLGPKLRDWLFLPDFRNPLEVDKLYLDFFILLLSCRQLICFGLEKTEPCMGGTNIEAHLDSNPLHNPKVPDFFAFGHTILDSIKSMFFFCFFWITLAVVFLAGTTRVSLFALGYVLGCFIFLWNGNEFYLKPIEVVFRLWKTIIAYTSAVILIKAILQIVGCVYITSLYADFCWVVQLLGIACLGKSQNNNSIPSSSSPTSGTCSAPYDEAGLLWDGICFAFLIIQKRIFCSYYFSHLIREIRAQQVLASRGAELIHEIQAKEVADQEQAEKEVMEKIKQKMDRIKAAQQKMFADKAKSIKSHKQEDYDYDVSPYSTAEGSLSHTPETEEPLSHTLPTVYSPTPSLPTIISPQSAMSSQPGYLEVYKVGPIRSIDARSSTVTFPSFSLKSGSSVGEDSFPLFSPSPTPTPYPNMGSLFTGLRVVSVPKEGHSDASSIFQSSTRTQIPQRVVRETPSRVHSFKRKASTRSHGSSVRSGGYYMFDENDSEIVDLNEKPRTSLIPDPEGDEMRKIAKLHGFTAFCAKLMKGEIDETEATIVSAEITTDIGESSKDSAIVSVDRDRTDPDASRPTTLTTIATSSPSSRPSSPSVQRKESYKPIEKGSGDEVDKVEEEEEPQRKESLFTKMKNWLTIVILFIESALISMTAKLNSLSRDYRYVARRLSVEKRYLKRIFEIEESNGSRYDFMDINWKKRTLAKISQSTVPKETKSIDSTDELHRKKRSKPEITEETKKSVLSEEAMISMDTELEDSTFLKANVYMRFFRSIFYAILSRSEVMCYIIIVLNQISSASVLSLPLPLFAFLWGSLSVPRPSKAFWITVITYTELIVVIKYIFQFQFWPWLASGKVDITPFWTPRIMGIERTDNYAQFDLALLLVLFFHRFMLKSLGLWDLSETEITAFMANAERKNSLSIDPTISSIEKSENTEKIKSDKKIKTDVESKALVISEIKEEPEENFEMDLLFREPDDQFSELSPSDDLKEESSEGMNAILSIISLTALKTMAIRLSKPFSHFFNSVLHPPYRITRDVYSLMFLCDFINFFILVFGFYAFGSGYSSSEDVASFLEENKIPIPFLVTLLLQFALIIIDRALYLRKYIKGKLFFQIFLTLGIHMWLFFALPAMTERRFTSRDNWPPKLWYIFKCIYFLLSAYQIRSGYPTRILGNTFCKKYNLINWYLFKGYMLIPFLYDLRMYMDWIWTDTSLVLDEWSLMEDIFVNLYERKCELKLDEEFPEPRGKAKRRFFKYLLGGAWVVLIIGLIWGPLGLFALGRAVGSTNRPVGATFELEFGGYQPIFRMSVTGSALNEVSDPLWHRLKTNEDFAKDAVAQTFISGYDKGDVTVVNLNGNSTAIWGVSPPSQKSLESDLRSNGTSIYVKLTYYITRKKQQKTQDMDVTISNEQTVELNPMKDSSLRLQIARMLSDEEDEPNAAIIPFIFPNYLRVPEKGKPTVVKQLTKKLKSGAEVNDTFRYRSVGVLLKKGKYENSSMTSWWEVHDSCNDTYLQNLDDFFKTDLLLKQKCVYLPLVLFNDKVFIGLLAFLSGYGIIGIYTTFVFLVSRWVRGLNSESSFKVIYTRMPNVDRVLQLCLDIYLVRESREFELEEDLYAKLIFLYRSPETLIKWTKPSEELPSGATELQRHPHSGR